MKRNGYTIAEAMITMAIIGIVASLTIPTFVSSQKKAIYANSLASAVSNFENAMAMMMSKEGVDDLLNTEAWRSVKSGTNYTLLRSSSATRIETFKNHLGRTLPIADYTTDEIMYSHLSNAHNGPSVLIGDPVRFKTKNGVEYLLIISGVSKSAELSEKEALNNGSNYLNKAGELFIDINGDNEPNVLGRDWFRYDIGTDGKLYPFGGQDYCIFHNITYTSPRTRCAVNKESFYCSAYLMENGYKMDY